MPLNLGCPSCGASYDLPDSLQGRPIRCITCGQTFHVPTLLRAEGASRPRRGNGGPLPWVLAGGAGWLLSLIGAGLAAGWLLLRPPSPQDDPPPPSLASVEDLAARPAPPAEAPAPPAPHAAPAVPAEQPPAEQTPAPAPREQPAPPPRAPIERQPPPVRRPDRPRAGASLAAGEPVIKSTEPLTASARELAQKTHDLFKTYCYRCHGKDGSAEGGFDFILNRDHLVTGKLLVPRAPPQSSRLFRRVQKGEMPPPDEVPRPGPEAAELLSRWIAAGAPAFEPDAPAAPPARADARPGDVPAGPGQRVQRPFVSAAAVEEIIAADLAQLPERDRRLTRYLTLTHLANAGLSDEELDIHRHALSKLINSLTWAGGITRPAAVDPGGTVFRINLRSYQWKERTWDLLAEADPYPVRSRSPAAESCREVTGCQAPALRGDWFVDAASRPPFYPALLELPSAEWELRDKLRVGWITAERPKPPPPARAGFANSGVSRNNRVLERWDLRNGAFWRTFDFAGNTGDQNIFEHPFNFKHEGGEVLFSLPNGLQGYMIIDAEGRRIDKGPVEIVSDPRRPDRAVETGLSCMSCHVNGLIEKGDQVSAQMEKRAAGKHPMAHGRFNETYGGQFDSLLAKDAQRYQNALKQTGAHVCKSDPVTAVALRYEAPLDLELAAAEVGLPAEEFVQRCRRAAKLPASVSLLLDGGTLKRDVFTEAFPALVRALDPSAVVVERPQNRGPAAREFAVPGWFACAAFLPDGVHALCGASTGKVQFLDLRTGKVLRTWEAGVNLQTLAVSSDGRRALTGGANSCALRLWDVTTGQEVRQFAPGPVVTVAFCGDDHHALALQGDGLRLWDVDTGQEVRHFEDSAGAGHLSVSADGRRALTDSGQSMGLRVWDVETGKETAHLAGHPYRVSDIALSPDGRRALTFAPDDTFRVWDADSGQELRRLAGQRLNGVAFTPDGTRAVTTDKDGQLRVWDVASGKELHAVPADGRRERVGKPTLCADGSHALGGGGLAMRLWTIPR
jgi:mono/diheme cytochrome c family protein/sugar lactone lactonase YvrE